MAARSIWVVQKTEAESDTGMVCAHHLAAAEAGASILARGGNAIDAAVATGFAVGVAEPFNSGVGGIAQLIYRDAASGKITVFDGTSLLPRRIDPAMFPLDDPPGIAGMYAWPSVVGDRNNSGWLAPAVPGMPACLLEAHARFGRLSRQEVMAPAIEVAYDGVDVDWSLSLALASCAELLARFSGSKTVYFRPSGVPLRPIGLSTAADSLRQPDLGRTLEILAREGATAFYRGEIADQIARQMADNGGLIDRDELATYRLRVFDGGIDVDYRDFRLTVAPESGGGLTVAQSLKILEGFDLRALEVGSADAVHLQIEAQRRAFLDRFRHLGDPAIVPVPFRGILSADYNAVRRSTIDLARATPTEGAGDPWPFNGPDVDQTAPELIAGPDIGHTTHLSVVDQERNMVSLTSTLGAIFGCGVVVPGTGILLNSGATWFDPRPGSQNSIMPGRRILWAGSPAIVSRRGLPFAAIGAPGGRRVISAVLQVLVNLLDYQMGIQDAISAPRVHCEGPEVLADSRYDVKTIGALRDLGHKITILTESVGTSSFGRPNGVIIDPATGRLRGGVYPYRPYYPFGL
jgi:gamma-glutamyltranspeptidase/glutathione hydrolase